jgi:hypothetical protein
MRFGWLTPALSPLVEAALASGGETMKLILNGFGCSA